MAYRTIIVLAATAVLGVASFSSDAFAFRGGGGVRGGVGYHGGVYRGAWAGRPYRWAPGGAIAAGAAIGVIAAGTAVAWAPPPPQPGLCWYYTDASQQQGFWDTCP